MFKEQMNKLKNLITKKTEKQEGEKTKDKTNKRKIENLVAFLVILIITLIAINSILGDDEVDSKEEHSPYKVLAETQKTKENEDDELEKRLEKILETMVGVR